MFRSFNSILPATVLKNRSLQTASARDKFFVTNQPPWAFTPGRYILAAVMFDESDMKMFGMSYVRTASLVLQNINVISQGSPGNKKTGCFQPVTGNFGGAERDRTVDLLNAIQALSQLSYSPTGRTSTYKLAHFLRLLQQDERARHQPRGCSVMPQSGPCLAGFPTACSRIPIRRKFAFYWIGRPEGLQVISMTV
jgi:hypothetical protein